MLRNQFTKYSKIYARKWHQKKRQVEPTTNDNPKYHAIDVLGLMGKKSTRAIPLLQSLTIHRDTSIRNRSKKALELIKSDTFE